MSDPLLAVAWVFYWLGAMLGVIGLVGGAIMIAACLNDWWRRRNALSPEERIAVTRAITTILELLLIGILAASLAGVALLP